MSARGALTLRCRDIVEEFDVVDGGVAIGASISVSVEARPRNPDAWPPVAMFCLEGAPIPTVGIDARTAWHCDFNAGAHGQDPPRLPKVHGYFSFHAMEVVMALRVLARSDHEIEFDLDATTEDPDHYYEAARPARWNGRFTLPMRTLGELWVPS